MHYYAHAEGVYINTVDRFLFVIGYDLWGYESGSAAFGEDYCFFVVECSEAEVDYFQSFCACIFIQGIFFLKQYIFWFDISMHDAFIL